MVTTVLGEALAARGVHVTCPRLPGHGTTPEAMAKIIADDLVRAVEPAWLDVTLDYKVRGGIHTVCKVRWPG